MNYCSRHRNDIAFKIKFHGLWKFVQTEPSRVAENTRMYLDGSIPRARLDPLVVMMLEIGVKAQRMLPRDIQLRGGRIAGCPLCNIVKLADDDAADAKVIKGMGLTVLALFQSQDLVPGNAHDTFKEIEGLSRRIVVTRENRA